MAFTTNIPGHVLIGDEDIVFGTASIGDDFGEVTSCTLSRTGDLTGIENSVGGFRAALITNPRWELEIETLFDLSVVPPELGAAIQFPYAGVFGRVTGDVQVKWQNKQSRMLSFKASHWDNMALETSPGSGVYENLAYTVARDGTTTPIP